MIEQSSILLKNPAAELYEILNRAACQEKEMQVESVFRFAMNLNEDSSANSNTKKWSKLYYLVEECKICLSNDKFNEAERDFYEVTIDKISVAIEGWQRAYYHSQNNNNSVWGYVGYLRHCSFVLN